MADRKNLAIAALALGIVGLFTAGGLVLGSLAGLALAGFVLAGRPSAGRELAWAAVAANVLALLTVLPVTVAVLAYRESPYAFQGPDDDALPSPAPQPYEGIFREPDVPPPPPPPPPTSLPPAVAPSAPTAGNPAEAVVPLRVGAGIREPKKTKNVPPAYPRDAIAARIEGTVVLECTISPQGKVVEVRTIRSVPMLDDAAIAAVKQWEYTPTLLNGVPVPVIMTVTLNFKLG
ncbi:MAG: energy transducer TonB [Vicinamibacteria bacterium]